MKVEPTAGGSLQLKAYFEMAHQRVRVAEQLTRTRTQDTAHTPDNEVKQERLRGEWTRTLTKTNSRP